jgi:hypothetical protein
LLRFLKNRGLLPEGLTDYRDLKVQPLLVQLIESLEKLFRVLVMLPTMVPEDAAKTFPLRGHGSI